MSKFCKVPSRAALVSAAVLLIGTPGAHAAFQSGSTGADGALAPLAGVGVVSIQLPPNGILNYTTINIPSGVTVNFIRNATNTPAYLLASGDVTIAGTIDVRGGTAAATGTYGDGALADDGQPGVGGPGGFDGGRGGREDLTAATAAISRGGSGLGPGGGPGGYEGGDNVCFHGINVIYKHLGIGGAHVATAYATGVRNCWNVGYSVGALQTKTYGSQLLQPVLIGGSGGGGGRGGTAYAGSGGGGGGGAILIASSGTLTVSGSIDATGGDGGGIAGTNVGSRGAGGSGGAIRLIAATIAGSGALKADGGCVHNGGLPRQLCVWDGNTNQHGGSPGRIRTEADIVTFAGTSNPAYVADPPGPVFFASAPTLRIASVAGQAVSVAPTGAADISLPASTTGPVTVNFETTNIPVGGTILLRLAPAYSTVTEVSGTISGTAAAGTAQVSVTLPQGPSTLQASTTYTVLVAMGEGDNLTRFAQNERVEKVEVSVPLQGGAKAKLITVSGKTYEVPYDTLRAAGFRG